MKLSHAVIGGGGILAAGILALIAPSLIEAQETRSAQAAEAKYHLNATAQDGRDWSMLYWPDDVSKCPTRNPAFTAGCQAYTQERLDVRGAEDARRKADFEDMAALVAKSGHRSASGHSAGYEWAEDNGIEDEGDCDNASASFVEGCQEFVEEQEARTQEDERAY